MIAGVKGKYLDIYRKNVSVDTKNVMKWGVIIFLAEKMDIKNVFFYKCPKASIYYAIVSKNMKKSGHATLKILYMSKLLS